MKTKYFIFTFFFFLCSCSKDKKQTSGIKSNTSDSISYYLKKVNKLNLPNTEKTKTLDQALTVIQNSDNSLKTRELNYEIITKYFETQEWSRYKNATEILLKNSLSSNDVVSLANSYRSFGNYYYQLNQPDSSFYFYTKAEKIYYKINDYDGYSTIMLKKGLIQFNANDNLGADLSLSKSLGALKKINDSKKKQLVLIQLGLNANELKEFSKAINYFNDALSIAKDNNFLDKYQESVCLSNIGLVYQNLNNHKKAITFFNKSLKYNNLKQDYPIAYSNIIDNLAYSNLQINNLNELPDLFFESLNIRKKLNDNSAIVLSYTRLSEYYYKTQQKNEALKYVNFALELAKRDKTPLDLMFSLKQASVVDDKNAAKYSDEYLKISDSLQIAVRNSKDRFARIQLETDEIIQEKEGLVEKNRTLLYVFVVSFILVALLFIVRAQRAKTRELLYKQAQQKANEDIFNLMMSQQSIIDESRNKEKKRLAQDLHDGVLGRMFGLRLNLDSLNNNNDEETVKRRFELLNELKTIEQDIREISHDLNREKQVLINNFVSIVHNLLEEQQSSYQANLKYTIDNSVNWDRVNNTVKINMYRILQEGLQNINKYANASNISVEIKGDNENLYLKIKDDGIGFDVNRKSKGIGMQNMISRTHDCQGIIDISSKKDTGTLIAITIPLVTKQKNVEQV